MKTVLGVAAMVALTDHDAIEAPDQLRSSEETREIPFSLQSSVPYEEAIFLLGVHNLPASRAHTIVADLAAYTQNPSGTRPSPPTGRRPRGSSSGLSR